MANNRMWLVHVPTRLACCLGKRLADGWWNRASPLNNFFTVLESEFDYGSGQQDDFALVMEDRSNAPRAWDAEWQYDDDVVMRSDGLRVLKPKDRSRAVLWGDP